ncbi:MAG: undecaprenyl-diphosphate phosphatase [Verrucomicrobiales bacterium]
MQFLRIIVFCLALAGPLQAVAVEQEGSDALGETARAGESLSYRDALILGVVEGITEYLPVSSTGHLILTNALLGLDADTPMTNREGEPIMLVDDDGEERPYALADAAYAYVIVIQAGAILAVVLLYWRTLQSIFRGCIGRDRNGRKLGINLIMAFLPAAAIGLLLDDWIESKLGDNIPAVAGALIVGAFVMLAVEHWRKRRRGTSGPIDPHAGPELHELPVSRAVMIGIFQCFAMWPGTSRSMATIVGGYVAGLSPARSAEFSFLLGLITLTAASGYKFVFDGADMVAALSPGPVLVGCLVAFVSAALAVKWLVGYLSKHGLALFAWYRIALAIVVFAVLS